MAVWAKPAVDTTIASKKSIGRSWHGEPRNDAFFPPHGSLFGNATHAGSGLAIGRNGVCVFEHGASYFAPVLVYPARLDGWVHLAVVYRDSQPSLYVNGRLVHTGLKSTLSVHPGISAQGDGADFVGELSAFTMSVRAMTPAEIAALAQSMPRPDARPQSHVIEFLRDAKGGIDTWAWLPGDYEFEYADARRRKISVPAVPAPAALTGPWQVRFPPARVLPQTSCSTSWKTGPGDRKKGFAIIRVRRRIARLFRCRGNGKADVFASIWEKFAIWLRSALTISLKAHCGWRRGVSTSQRPRVLASIRWKSTLSMPGIIGWWAMWTCRARNAKRSFPLRRYRAMPHCCPRVCSDQSPWKQPREWTACSRQIRLSVPLPKGYDFDGCDRETLLKRLAVREGRLVLPHAVSYQYLMLPDETTMTPQLARRVGALVEAGASVIGPRPERSPNWRRGRCRRISISSTFRAQRHTGRCSKCLRGFEHRTPIRGCFWISATFRSLLS